MSGIVPLESLPELAVIGWPLERTYSPAMHRTALAGTGLDWKYGAVPVRPGDLTGFVLAAARQMRGINVTTPHKGAVAALCTEMDRLARAAGAVNTVVFGPAEAVRGHNTDGPGMLAALAGREDFDPGGCSAAVIGAGGSARAAAAALAGAGAAKITFINRTQSLAESVCRALGRRFPGTAWTAGPLGGPCDGAREELAGAGLILSCVPPGAAPAVVPLLQGAPEGAVFMDLAYGPSPTALHLCAAGAGLRAVPGLEMLLWQGVLAFELFTGISEPAATAHRMREALAAAAGEWWLC